MSHRGPHQARYHRQTVAAVGGDRKLAIFPDPDAAVLLHQLTHPVLAYMDALGQQPLVHPRPAVVALDLVVDGLVLGQQRFSDRKVCVRPTHLAHDWS